MLIAEYFLKSIYTGLGPIIWHFGLGGVIVICALLWAYFMPVFKKTALWVAFTMTIIMIAFVIGVQDEKARWEAKEANAAAIAGKAHEAAVDRVDRGKSGGLHDKYNRDK